MTETKRFPCAKCGTLVLPTTLKINNGLCGPCARGDQNCIRCGERVSNEEAGKELIHIACAMARDDEQIAQESGIKWKCYEDIDWEKFEASVLLAIRNSLARFVALRSGEPVAAFALGYWIGEGFSTSLDFRLADDVVIRFHDQDEELRNELRPIDNAIIRISEGASDEESEAGALDFYRSHKSMMESVFALLKKGDFGLQLAPGFICQLIEN